MRLAWIFIPIAQCAFLALALAGCLALVLSLKRQLAVVHSSVNESRDSAAASAAAAAAMTAELAALRRDAESAEAARLTGQELNLTRRVQALRMERRGESPATIAAALRLPRNEIDLLLKIRKLSNGHGLPLAADRHKSTQSA